MKDHQVNGAPIPLILGDREFRATPLTDRDHSELDLWVQGRVLRIARASCEGISIEDRREILEIALEKASGTTWMHNLKVFATFEGASRLAWQMIKSNEEVAFEEVRNLCRTVDSIKMITETFNILHPATSSKGPEKN